MPLPTRLALKLVADDMTVLLLRREPGGAAGATMDVRHTWPWQADGRVPAAPVGAGAAPAMRPSAPALARRRWRTTCGREIRPTERGNGWLSERLRRHYR